MIQREMISKLIPLILETHDKITAYLAEEKKTEYTPHWLRSRNAAIKKIGEEFYDSIINNGMSIDNECTKNDMGEIIFRSAYNVTDGKNPADFVGTVLQELDCHSDIHN